MTSLKDLKISRITHNELSKRQQNMLRGGETICPCACGCFCGTNCGCLYAGPQEGPDDDYFGGSILEIMQVLINILAIYLLPNLQLFQQMHLKKSTKFFIETSFSFENTIKDVSLIF